MTRRRAPTRNTVYLLLSVACLLLTVVTFSAVSAPVISLDRTSAVHTGTVETSVFGFTVHDDATITPRTAGTTRIVTVTNNGEARVTTPNTLTVRVLDPPQLPVNTETPGVTIETADPPLPRTPGDTTTITATCDDHVNLPGRTHLTIAADAVFGGDTITDGAFTVEPLRVPVSCEPDITRSDSTVVVERHAIVYGDVTATSQNVELQRNVTVHGRVTTDGQLDVERAAVVHGGVQTGGAVTLQSNVEFTGDIETDAHVTYQWTAGAAPTVYGDVVTQNGGTLERASEHVGDIRTRGNLTVIESRVDGNIVVDAGTVELTTQRESGRTVVTGDVFADSAEALRCTGSDITINGEPCSEYDPRPTDAYDA